LSISTKIISFLCGQISTLEGHTFKHACFGMTGGPSETQGTPLQPAYACGSLWNDVSMSSHNDFVSAGAKIPIVPVEKSPPLAW
jgi:hypothetical protein